VLFISVLHLSAFNTEAIFLLNCLQVDVDVLKDMLVFREKHTTTYINSWRDRAICAMQSLFWVFWYQSINQSIYLSS